MESFDQASAKLLHLQDASTMIAKLRRECRIMVHKGSRNGLDRLLMHLSIVLTFLITSGYLIVFPVFRKSKGLPMSSFHFFGRLDPRVSGETGCQNVYCQGSNRSGA